MDRLFFGLGAASAFIAVAAGAFGAHALRARLAPDLLAVFETGGALPDVSRAGADRRGLGGDALARARWPHWAGWLFVAGTVLFSGSLYALALSGVRWLGAITPLGGVAFLAGWVCLALALAARRGTAMRQPERQRTIDGSMHATELATSPTPTAHLLTRLDAWFAAARRDAGGIVPCREGCTACCHGPFDISVADAELIGEALDRMPATRPRASHRARARRSSRACCALEPTWSAALRGRRAGRGPVRPARPMRWPPSRARCSTTPAGAASTPTGRSSAG